MEAIVKRGPREFPLPGDAAAHEMNILIAEDEPIIALDIQRTLEKLGYRVCDVVDTGERAVEAAEACRPDLVLLDIKIGRASCRERV